MKTKFIKMITAVVAVATVFTMNAANVNAASLDSMEDSAGNVFVAGSDFGIKDIKDGAIDGEVFAAGKDIDVDNAVVDGSVFVAGMNLSVEDSVVDGSAFLAGQNIDVDSIIDKNIFVAGQDVSLKDNTEAKAAYVAGATIDINGAFDCVNAAGGIINFDAEVDGDVTLDGDVINIGDNAKVTGDIIVKYGSQLNVSDNAKVENIQSTKVEDKSGVAVEKVTAGAVILGKVKKCISLLFGNAVLALLFAFFLKRDLKKANAACKANPGSFLGYGAIALIAAPVAIIVCLITVIGAKAAGVATLIYILTCNIAGVFAFASFVRELMFGKAGKRLNPVAEIVISVLPLAVIKVIPVIGGLVSFACLLYTFGYMVNVFVEKAKETE